MKLSVRPGSFLLMGVLFTLMAATGGLMLTLNLRRHAQGKWVAHTLDVIGHVETAKSLLSELRYQERNAALGLVGSDRQPYETAKHNAASSLIALRKLSVDNLSQQTTLDSIDKEWNRYLGEGDANLRDGIKQELTAPIFSQGHRDRFARVVELLERMKGEESRLLSVRQAALHSSQNQSDRVVIAAFGWMALALGTIVGLLWRVQKLGEAASEAESREVEVRERLETANGLLAKMTEGDDVTQLANGKAFRARLEAEVESAKRFGRPLSLALLEVDDFAAYVKAYGQAEGDSALKVVARVIEDYAPSNGLGARWGGEGFSLLLEGVGAEESLRVAERISRAVSAVKWPLRQLSVTIGVASLSPLTEDADDLMDTADRALMEAAEVTA